MASFPERINTQWSKDSGVSRNMENPKFRQQKPYEVLRDNGMPESGLNHVAYKALETRYQVVLFQGQKGCLLLLLLSFLLQYLCIIFKEA